MTDDQLLTRLDAVTAALKNDGNTKCSEVCEAVAARLRVLLRERRR